jgi:hypothetical protein
MQALLGTDNRIKSNKLPSVPELAVCRDTWPLHWGDVLPAAIILVPPRLRVPAYGATAGAADLLLEAHARPLLRRRLDQEPLRPLRHQGVSGEAAVVRVVLTYCTCMPNGWRGVRWCRVMRCTVYMTAVPYCCPAIALNVEEHVVVV